MAHERYALLNLTRKMLERGALHPVQVSVVRLHAGLAPGDDEEIVHKVLLHCDGVAREVRVPPGEYAVRAREVPLGCNVQSEELRLALTLDEPAYVVLRVGTSLQVLFAGFGGCLLPPRHGSKAFYVDEVSAEAFKHELERAPEFLRRLAKKLGAKRGRESAAAAPPSSQP